MYKQHNPYAYTLAASASEGLFQLLRLVGGSHSLAKVLKPAMEAIDAEFSLATVELPIEPEGIA